MSDLVGFRYTLRALGGRMGSEWERERRDTLFLMGAIAFAVMPQAPHLPIWIPIAFALMFIWRLAIVFSGRPLPTFSVRLLGAIACIAAVGAQYGSLVGREQGVAMLTLFLGLKLLEMKARRDLFVVTFLCFFLLLTTFFKSQSFFTAALVIGSVSALLATMITMQFGNTEAPISRRFRHAMLILLQAAPIAIALFLLFPRLSTPLWGFQGDGASSRTGLSSEMAPGNVANLSKSETVALRVSFDGKPPTTRQLYWRGPVFGYFDGRTWSAPRYENPQQVQSISVELNENAKPLTYTVTSEPSGNDWLMALDVTTKVEPISGYEVLTTPELTLKTSRPQNSRMRYTVHSHLNYSLGKNESRENLRRYKQLPPNMNPKTRALANKWRSDPRLTSTTDYVNRALLMFREQEYFYTLQPPLLGEHSVDDFLFSTQRGFCEHFTSSFVVLMRMLGVPTRVVTGYQGGKINPVDGYMVVRQSDAHAWAEYWSPNDGWVRVDPTAAVAPERIESDFRLSESPTDSEPGAVRDAWNMFQLNLDAIANRWNQWVLNYDRSSQKKLLDGVGLDGDNWYGLAGLLAGALTLLIGGSALLTLQPRARKDPTADAYEAYCVKLAAQGLTREQHETPIQFFKRASRHMDEKTAAQARRIVMMYTNLRYGSLSSVYLGEERRKLSRDRVTKAAARRIAKAKEGLRTLRRAVKSFAP
jgi:transglutaminase-like putative cysteine protease